MYGEIPHKYDSYFSFTLFFQKIVLFFKQISSKLTVSYFY